MYLTLFGFVKTNLPVAKSPLTFVMTIMFTLLLMSAAVLGMTASGRQTSSRYVEFTGLYDLALASNGRAMRLLDGEFKNWDKLLEEDVEKLLTFRGGEFYLDANLLWDWKQIQLEDFLADNFGYSRNRYYFSYSLTVPTGVYFVRTYIYPRRRAFDLRSVAYKKIDGVPGSSTRVSSRIEWPGLADVKLIPISYTWRNGPPGFFYDLESIHLDDGTITLPDINLAFANNLNEAVRRRVFDSIGLTRFEEFNTSTNISLLLGYLKINDFEVDLELFDDIRPQMLRVRKAFD